MPTHSIWSMKPVRFEDIGNGLTYNTSDLEAAAAGVWTEGIDNGHFHVTVKVRATGDIYEIILSHLLQPGSADKIEGRWDVKRNGTLISTVGNRDGSAYALSQPVAGGTNYFKIYIGTPSAWHFSGYIHQRFDY